MSESVLGHLNLDQLGNFSYMVLDTRVNVEGDHVQYWIWDLFGHIKMDETVNGIGRVHHINNGEVDMTNFLRFRSDIGKDLLKKIYPESSNKFRRDHIHIVHSVPWLDGVEFDVIDLIFSGLEPHRSYSMDMIIPLVRDRKISNILTT